MSKKRIYNFGKGFRGIYCKEFDDIIIESLKFPPCNSQREKIESEVGKLIVPIYFNASLWTQFISLWLGYMISLAYAFYSPELNKIFLNLRALGFSVTKTCGTPSALSTEKLRQLNEIVSHELSHYIFQNKTGKTLSISTPYLKKYYRTFWFDIVSEDISPYIADANYSIATLLDKTTTDVVVGSLNKRLLNRFLRILKNLRRNHPNKILDKNKYQEVLQTIELILLGVVGRTRYIYDNFARSYTVVFGDYPRNIGFGQELAFASEIIAIASNIRTSKAKNLSKRILSLL